MNLTTAKVITNEKLLNGQVRPHARSVIDSHLLWLECPEIAKDARPGQYIMVRCGEIILPRPFSIHQAKDGQIVLFFAVWEGGKGTNWLSQRRIGDSVEIFGPLGNGFSISEGARNLLLVAGGIGIAPLYYLAEQALSRKRKVALLYGTADNSRYREFPKDLELVAATEDGSVGHHGLITELIPEHARKADQIFACGPLAMYRSMARMPELKNKPVQVSLEVRMGCGRGVCYGCTIKTKSGLKKVCEDGPVFEMSDVVWDELGL